MKNKQAKFYILLIIVASLLLILFVIEVFDKRIQKIEAVQQLPALGK